MFKLFIFFIYSIIIAKLSFIATNYFHDLFKQRGYVAIPNKRSNHSKLIPISGGISIISVFTLSLIPSLIFFDNWELLKVIIFAFIILTVVFFLDDLFDTSITIRLITQFIVTIITALLLKDYGSLSFLLLDNFLLKYHGYIDFIVYLLFLVGFMNYFNFMDGIDGMSSVEMTSLSLSIIIISLAAGIESYLILVLILLIVSSFGFIYNNWHPAKVFLGDSGSIPIGYILALALLIFAIKGLWLQMLIISLYYLTEPTIVILKLLSQGKKFWLPHNEYFFHQAAKAGQKHSKIVLKVALCNVCLLFIALLSIYFKQVHQLIYLFAALIIVFATLKFFNKKYYL